MELIRGVHNLKSRHRGCVATIGNFDGVHRGHQAVIAQLLHKAQALKLPSVVILFEPQPLEFFRPEAAPARLTRLREKLQLLRATGVERVLCLYFDGRQAAMTAQEFIERILVEGLGVRYLVVGDDFRFGNKRTGDFGLLQLAGRQHGFDVAPTETFNIDGERVSSTRVRQALATDKLAQAHKLLGRPYVLSGRVIHGDKRGRELDMPTANINPRRRLAPIQGIYVVEMSGYGDLPLPGVASIGTRPTVGGRKLLLEVHVLDFQQNLYGQYVSVEFLHKLREEKHFSSMQELRLHMQRDRDETRAWFRARD